MKTYLVTGANSGLGLETTRALARSGARVVMAVRDPQRGQAARDALMRESPQASISVATLNLSDLASVRALAAQPFEVDVLVNNAGVGSGPLRLTAEGVVEPFAVNHLGHFLLSALLFDRLSARAEARVVTVGSGFGKSGTLDFENLDGSKGYGQMRAYVQSKRANTLFAAELDRRLRARGSNMKSVLAHPGVASTQMQHKPKGLAGLVGKAVAALFARSAQSGALPLAQAAAGADVRGGEVYGPGKGEQGAAVKEARWPLMDDLDSAQRLWARSEQLAAVRFL